MKHKILLVFVSAFFVSVSYAQKSTAYAITAQQKGQRGWTEVRLVDFSTGNEIQTIYQASHEIQVFDARTGSPVSMNPATENRLQRTINSPFATTSAACAYDKKHDRLYYTPMGINQLRYIDLKSKTPKIFYFEGEALGALKNPRDIPNQVTRMTFASNGHGYALTNNASHLIQFTTSKKPVITDLGAVTDDPANTVSVRHGAGFGGDMVADTRKNLYLITANRHVFRIAIETKVATYLGSIKGLPHGFTTNGAAVEEGTKVIVGSSNSTIGYYRFDIETLTAEKVSGESTVYNASDLANGNLITVKKPKKEKNEEVKDVVNSEVSSEKDPVTAERLTSAMDVRAGTVSVYPNPVTQGVVRLSFDNQPQGRYQIQFMDISGKIISTRPATITASRQVEMFRLPDMIAGGNYLIKVVNLETEAAITTRVVVQ